MGFLDYEGLKLFKKTLTDNFCADYITSANSVVAGTSLSAPTITKGDAFDVKGAKVLYDGWLLGEEETGVNEIGAALGGLTNKQIKECSCLEIVFYDGSFDDLEVKEGESTTDAMSRTRPVSYRWYDPKPGQHVFLHSFSWETTSDTPSQNQVWLKVAKLSLSPVSSSDNSIATIQLAPAYEVHSVQPTSGITVTGWQASSATGKRWEIALQKVIAWA